MVLLPPTLHKFRAEVQGLTEFKPAPLLEEPGWAGNCFAFPCGTVISSTKPKARALFRPMIRRASLGTVEEWRDSIAEPLAGQMLPAFLLMAAFAAPLLKLTTRTDNFGFEIVGAKGTGKTTVLKLMATTAGAGIDNGQGAYWQSLNSTHAGLETQMQRHQDMPMLLDEAGLFMPDQSLSNRARSMVQLAIQLGEGRIRTRFEQLSSRQYRFIFVLSSNEPAAQTMRGGSADREAAAMDRLLTLPVPDNGYGIFDSLPERFSSGSEFSQSLEAAMTRYYGTALRRFIRILVKRRAEDEKKLREDIAESLEKFRAKAEVDLNNGSAVRVCDAFGLVYAAGRLARRYKVLPLSYMPAAITLEMYRRHLGSRDERSPVQTVLDLVGSPNVLKVKAGKLPALSRDEIEACAGIVYHGRKDRELLLTEFQAEKLLPPASSICEIEELERAIVRDKDHRTTKRQVSSELEPLRLYCLRLSKLQK
ncbi:DUF927 domain-containing protein [Altericroceibacterium endophyticum]|uniref:DUF927 domain-containing protein n=1 Tax=Altericroceibacterium endophyticum TaxID=1808508 RepID=A0A6I4T9X1_9SPHN|nr:DUF927 domain-containing protein [Altericroceibacterium endophyticum]MXO66670.1 DUF927 domain-containing protein [Altericroceibacterium endophyticum]